MILIAVWLVGRDPAESPSLIYWADGTIATEEDYVRHLDDTYTFVSNPDGSLQKLVFPELSGEAFYDSIERVWKIRPHGKILQTDLRNPLAHDHDIVVEMSTFPIVYNLTVSRTKATENLRV
jgi:hypothetical protein